MEQTLKQRRKGFIAMLLVFLMVFESLPLEVLAESFSLGTIYYDGWDSASFNGKHVVAGDTISWTGGQKEDGSVEYNYFNGEAWVSWSDTISQNTTSITVKNPSELGQNAAYDSLILYWNVDGIYTYESGGVSVTSINLWAVTRLCTVSWNYMDPDGNPVKDTDENVDMGTFPSHDDPPPYSTVSKNYTFRDWTPELSRVSGDIEYYAMYDEETRQYDIIFVDDDNETVLKPSVSYNYGTEADAIAKPANPTKPSDAQYDYTFNCWVPELHDVTGPETYTASYNKTLRSYTVSWNDADGTTLETDLNVPYGTTPTFDGLTPSQNATVSKNYTFAGWTPEVGAITGDTVYTATYTEQTVKYPITWRDDDDTLIDTTQVEYGVVPTHTDPVKAATVSQNYTFAGWTPDVVAVTGAATYNATYTVSFNKCTIKFVNGSDELSSAQYDWGTVSGDIVQPATPIKASDAQYDYTFKGWEPALSDVTGDQTYTASFNQTLRKYTVSWNNADGSTLETDNNVPYGTTPTYNGDTPSQNATVSENYTFAGWTPAVGPITGDTVYTATYTATPIEYTITWLNDNESLIDTTQVAYGVVPTHADASKAATVSKNYTFAGWSPAVVAVTGDATYKATYTETAIQYTVKFVNGTTEISSTAYDWGTPSANIAVPANPTKDQDAQYTYTFSGWSPALEDVKRDITYTAQFTATLRRYTVTWVNYDGSVLETDSNVPYGDMPSYNGSTPTKPDDADTKYSFAGWSPSVTNVTRDITYTATFTGTTTSYPITWKDDDGTIIEVTRVAAGATPTHADPMKPATAEYTYTFSGWTPEIVPATAPATYTATYTAVKNKYKITWLDDLGKEIDTTEVEYGVVPTHADAVKQDTEEYTYTFDGWDPEPVAVTEDAVYSAKFKEKRNTFTITWKNDDGSTIDTTEVSYGEMPSHADPAKKDTAKYKYTFKGWTPAITAATADATYTAEYDSEQKVYKVTWQDYDGSILGVQKYHYGDRPSFGDPSRPADDKYEYVFAGWSPAIRPVTSNATYIAQYDAKTLMGAGDKDPSSDSDNSSSRVKNVAQQVNTNNASGTPVKSPQTGGEDPMRTAAMAVLILSSTATAALIIRRRRRQNTK